jgi:hypothetical protein
MIRSVKVAMVEIYAWSFISLAWAFVAFFSWRTISLLISVRQLQRWRASPATILETGVKARTEIQPTDQSESPIVRSYFPHVVYTYIVNGIELHNDVFSRPQYLGRSPASIQWVIDKYPPGAVTTCYYDPSDVRRSVLWRGISPTFSYLFLATIIFTVAAALASFAVWSVAIRGIAH